MKSTLEQPTKPPLLEVIALQAGYGSGKTVLHGVDFALSADEELLILGHNGAGKTTLLNTIFGLIRPVAGQIRLDGRPLTGTSSARVQLGLSYTAGGRSVFPGLTVMENLTISADVVHVHGKELDGRLDEIYQLFPDLRSRLGQQAGNLSGGQQRMLAVSMAVMQHPRLLLLDEPSLGLAPIIVERLYQGINSIRKHLKIAVLVVEQSINPEILDPEHLLILRMGRVAFYGQVEEMEDVQQLFSQM